MKLDFTKLESLANGPATQRPQEAENGPPKDYRKLEQLKSRNELEASRDKQRAQNTTQAEHIIGAITQGVATGENPYKLLLEAVNAIALLTNNPCFFNQLCSDIQRIHGFGLLEPQALEIELNNVSHRLERLRESEARTEEIIRENNYTLEEYPLVQNISPANLEAASDLRRIKHAIRQHEKRITEIKALMASKGQALETPTPTEKTPLETPL